MTTTVSGLGVKFLCSLCTECPCCRRMERNMSRRWTCRLCSVVAGYIHSLVAQRAPVGRRQVAVHMQYMEWLLLAQDQHAWDGRLQLPCAARDAWYTLTEMHPVQWMTITFSLVPRPCPAFRCPRPHPAFCHLPYCKWRKAGRGLGTRLRKHVGLPFSGRCGPLIVHAHMCTHVMCMHN